VKEGSACLGVRRWFHVVYVEKIWPCLRAEFLFFSYISYSFASS
jgi:hypothetical protein